MVRLPVVWLQNKGTFFGRVFSYYLAVNPFAGVSQRFPTPQSMSAQRKESFSVKPFFKKACGVQGQSPWDLTSA